MYVGVILSLWKYLSKLWKKDAYAIQFEEMVSPDKILQVKTLKCSNRFVNCFD
jgi:hypothetical protein